MIQDIWQAIDSGDYAGAEVLLRADHDLMVSHEGQMAAGYLYSHTGRCEEARQIFSQLRQKHAGQAFEHIALHQMARTERLAGEHERALELFWEERELIQALSVKESEQTHKLAVNSLEMSVSQRALGRHSEARSLLEACLKQTGPEDPETRGRAERYLGELLLELGEEEQGRQHLERALSAFAESEDSEAAAQVSERLSGLRA